jgi:hypothetical protein
MKKEQPPYIEMCNYGTTIRVTFDHNDISIDEIEDALRGILIGLTFSPNTVDELFGKDGVQDTEQTD